jgi:hypothetical protein
LLEDLYETQNAFVRFGPSLAPLQLFEKDAITHLFMKETRHLDVAAAFHLQVPESFTLGLIRCPLAVLASWRNAPKEFRPGWDFEAEWRTAPKKNSEQFGNVFGFEAWKRTTRLLLDLQRQSPGRVRIVEYRDLLKDPPQSFRSIFEWLGLDFEPQTEKFLCATSSRSIEGQDSVYRGFRATDVGWKNVLERETVRLVKEELAGTELERFIS